MSPTLRPTAVFLLIGGASVLGYEFGRSRSVDDGEVRSRSVITAGPGGSSEGGSSEGRSVDSPRGSEIGEVALGPQVSGRQVSGPQVSGPQVSVQQVSGHLASGGGTGPAPNRVDVDGRLPESIEVVHRDVTDPVLELGPTRSADSASETPDSVLADPSPEQALGSVRSVAQRALPAVVSLDVLRDNDSGGDLAAAAGFVWNQDGLVVTASHVVDDALVVVAQFADGSRYPMSVVGRDPRTDLAVLRFDQRPEELAVLPTKPSAGLWAGDWVVMIGGPLGLDHSVSAGLVSHTERRLRTEDGRGTEVYLQLTGLVHPGSSGGPVLDLAGRVVGVTIRKTTGGDGISFALPVETVTAVVDRILDDEDKSVRYDLGATLYEHRRSGGRDPIPDGAIPEGGVAVSVVQVERGRAADRAGLRSGDVLVTVNREPIRSLRELEDGLSYGDSGPQVEFGVVRQDSEEATVEVELLPVPVTEDPSMKP